MNKRKINKPFMPWLVVLLALGVGFWTFMFCNAIYFYFEFELDYSDLSYEELTFDRYDSKRGYKSTTRYEVYFEEYEKSFELSPICNKKIDVKALKELNKGETLKVYYCDSSAKNHDYEICEFSSNSTTFLSLGNYVKTNQNNQISGMIICPIFILVSLFLIIILFRYDKIMSKDRGLGKVKLEYIQDNNVIRVYNSLTTCSLVINDKVVDEYVGLVGSNFVLTGKINIDGKRVKVSARMGDVNMRLYWNDKLVSKKFILFW